MRELEEQLAVVTGMWGEGPFSFEGRRDRVRDLDALPKPVQRRPNLTLEVLRFTDAGPLRHADRCRGLGLEVKFDGMRAQLRLDGGTLCLRSRPGRDCTEAFPELGQLSAGFRRRRLLLDGERVCLNQEGEPDFARRRARLRSAGRQARLAAQRSPATFLGLRWIIPRLTRVR